MTKLAKLAKNEEVKSVSIHDAKTNLSRLIAAVEAGEEVVLRRRDTPVARIVPYLDPAGPRVFGSLRGQIRIAPDFEDLPPDFDEYVS